MNSYQIVIYGMQDEDMLRITEALAAAGVTDAGDPDIGPYQQNYYPRCVFVGILSIGKAVRIINALGFATDEDQLVKSESVDASVEPVRASALPKVHVLVEVTGGVAGVGFHFEPDQVQVAYAVVDYDAMDAGDKLTEGWQEAGTVRQVDLDSAVRQAVETDAENLPDEEDEDE